MFGMELMDCQGLAVPREVMQHVVRVESSFNPYAIGVVGGRLARQPRTLPEAVATARMLERRGYNFSLGLAQVNRHNLARQGLDSYARAFEPCPNLQAGARILAECHGRSGGSWGRAFSCYYSGNFTTGFRHGYVQKVFASMHGARGAAPDDALAIDVIGTPVRLGVPRRTAGAVAAKTQPRAAPTRSTSASRIAARVVITPVPPAAAPAVPPAAAPGTNAHVPEPAVAVIDAAGGPPRLVPVGTSGAAPATQAQAPPPAMATPVDAAFVF